MRAQFKFPCGLCQAVLPRKKQRLKASLPYRIARRRRRVADRAPYHWKEGDFCQDELFSLSDWRCGSFKPGLILGISGRLEKRRETSSRISNLLSGGIVKTRVQGHARARQNGPTTNPIVPKPHGGVKLSIAFWTLVCLFLAEPVISLREIQKKKQERNAGPSAANDRVCRSEVPRRAAAPSTSAAPCCTSLRTPTSQRRIP